MEDSHSRNISNLLSHKLGPNFKVVDFVNTGASMEKIVKSAKQIAVNLTQNGHFIILVVLMTLFNGGISEVPLWNLL